MAACFRFFVLPMGLLLNVLQLGAAPPRLDPYGDPLPPGALARIGTRRFRHYAKISSLAYSPDGKLIAGGDSFEGIAESSIVVWDAQTGRQLHRLEGHGHVVRDLAFSPDSKRLIAACGDGSRRIWDVNADWDLALAGDAAVAFLKERITPVRPVPAERFATLIADLDSERFEVREKAQSELIRLGEATIPLLRKTREQGRPSLELRRRVEYILEHLDEWEQTPEGVRALRAIDVLEHSDSSSARALLECLAGGVAESGLTSEAKAALKRLDRRSARK